MTSSRRNETTRSVRRGIPSIISWEKTNRFETLCKTQSGPRLPEFRNLPSTKEKSRIHEIEKHIRGWMAFILFAIHSDFIPNSLPPLVGGRAGGGGFPGKGAIIHALGIIATHVIQTGVRGPYRLIRSLETAAPQSYFCWMDILQRSKSAGRKEDPTVAKAVVGLGHFAHTGG